MANYRISDENLNKVESYFVSRIKDPTSCCIDQSCLKMDIREFGGK
jgi:hypothetical protein